MHSRAKAWYGRRTWDWRPGKGEALWKSPYVTKGDLLVFVDADLTQWGPHFVTGGR